MQLQFVTICFVLLLGLSTAQQQQQQKLSQEPIASGDFSPVTSQQALFTGQANYRAAFRKDMYRFKFPNVKANSDVGGSTNLFDIDTDPALYDNGVGQELVTVEPCGLDQPHLHPRSAEVSHVLSGTLSFGLVEENGPMSRAIIYTLTKGQSIFIPQGYIHFAQNLEGEAASYIASYATPDFGTVTIVQQFFRLPPVTLAAVLGLSVQETMTLADKATDQPLLSLGRDCKAGDPPPKYPGYQGEVEGEMTQMGSVLRKS